MATTDTQKKRKGKPDDQLQLPTDDDQHVSSPIEKPKVPDGYVQNPDYTWSPKP